MEALQVQVLRARLVEKCSLGLRRGDGLVILGKASLVFS